LNKYFVIFSKDPYLLARFSMELQMDGYKPYTFDGGYDLEGSCKWLAVYKKKHPHTFFYMEHMGCPDPTRFTLTESNYSKVLTEVLINNK
jgi:hypothetical protein